MMTSANESESSSLARRRLFDRVSCGRPLCSYPQGASATFCAEHSKVLIGPKFTLAEFKRRVSEAFDELFLSGEFERRRLKTRRSLSLETLESAWWGFRDAATKAPLSRTKKESIRDLSFGPRAGASF